MAFIPGDVTLRLHQALKSQAIDDTVILIEFDNGGAVPLLDGDGVPITLGDLRGLLAPFSVWLSE